MGIFDHIRHTFNPEVKTGFEILYKQYYKGLKSFCLNPTININPSSISNPSYYDMKRIVENTDSIIRLHKLITSAEEKIESDKAELNFLQFEYPHAFVHYCNECLGGIIYDKKIIMPGCRQSSREKQNNHSSNPIIRPIATGKYYGNLYNPIPNNGGDVINRIKSPKSYLKEPQTINDLTIDDIRKILDKKDFFESKENEILALLKQEEIRIKFDDEVYDNPRRRKYYKLFLTSHSKTDTDIAYLVHNLSDLDLFITESINSIYIELKQKYPKGLPAFEKYYSYGDGKNSANLTIEEIIKSEESIAQFEFYADTHSKFKNWEQEQSEFAAISRSLCPNNFGCYYYDINFPGIKADGSVSSGKYRVWQLFFTAFYNVVPGTTISKDFVYLSKNAAENTKILNGSLNYKNSVYEKIWDLIVTFKEKVGDISIVFASNGLNANTTSTFNHKKFEYLISKIETSKIPYYEIGGEELTDRSLSRHILILELITSNVRLRQTVEAIRNKFSSECPLIAYISLRKGYDFLEVEQLEINAIQKGKEQKEEAERRRIQDEKEQNKKAQIKNSLLTKVVNWHLLFGNFHYYSLLKYFPITCNFEANETEWDDRWTVWNFKNTPGKTSLSDHEEALDYVIPRIVSVLEDTFGRENLKYLTLVCIPASTAVKNQARYEVFSQRLCSETGMSNAFDKMQIINSSEEKKFGGNGICTNNIAFDNKFFQGKYVLLFDDVITKGDSMFRFKRKMEKLNAIVIGGLSIGKTTHSR
ncbi:MAG: hypothetical protein K2H60_04165 [Muribaculaceae bacterium]|nr:hypothetical protein [Muribaculaceae bacterium]